MVVFINQIRMKIGVMFGSPETTTGGNALKFYASVRLDIRRIGAVKDRDEVTGNQTRVKVVKNKLAPPFKQVEFDIMYGEGVSKTGELIDLGVKAGVVEKSGAWFSYNSQRLGQGRENAKQFLKDNPEMANEIELSLRQNPAERRKSRKWPRAPMKGDEQPKCTPTRCPSPRMADARAAVALGMSARCATVPLRFLDSCADELKARSLFCAIGRIHKALAEGVNDTVAFSTIGRERNELVRQPRPRKVRHGSHIRMVHSRTSSTT